MKLTINQLTNGHRYLSTTFRVLFGEETIVNDTRMSEWEKIVDLRDVAEVVLNEESYEEFVKEVEDVIDSTWEANPDTEHDDVYSLISSRVATLFVSYYNEHNIRII